MKTPGLNIIALLCCFVPGLAQNANLDQLVSLDYSGSALSSVIADMERDYGVYFSYSEDHILLDYPISVFAQNVPLNEALELMFEDTPIVFALIGGQIMLRMDPTKAEDRISNTPQQRPEPAIKEPEPTPELEVPEEEIVEAEPQIFEPKEEALAPIEAIEKPVKSSKVSYDFAKEDKRFLFLDSLNAGKDNGQAVAQLSVFPRVGTNGEEGKETTNNLSVNVFWGNNGGVDGLELGGFVNTIQNDVKGLQVAGFGNRVKGNLRGTQVSGLFNVTGGNSTGIQATSILNFAESSNGVQASGLINVTEGAMNGLQAAGLFNKSGGGSITGIQLAGLFNANFGQSDIQTAGLLNVGNNVRIIQAAALLNVAKKVNGIQIGLINIADTVGGASIGLLNIVRKGYNKVDLTTESAMRAGVGLKLGSQHFYNIFQAGANWDNSFFPKFRTSADPFTHWMIGYGVGTAITLGSRSSMNFEFLANHVNEGMTLTTDLNLLNQFRLVVDYKIFGFARIFGGATFNLMVSKYYNQDIGKYGSTIVPYTWKDYSTGLTDIRSWIGFTAGVRF